MTFTRWRVVVLSLALFATGSWAVGVLRERSARRRWTETLRVAVVVISPGAPPADQVDAVSRGLGQLEERLAQEATRYAPGAPRPFAIDVVGPVSAAAPPLPPEGGLLVRARHALELWRALRAIHAGVVGFTPRAYDARLYLTLVPPAEARPRFAEGVGAAGGEVGLVRAAVDPADPTLAVEALAHELLHCLGATDKYGADGHAQAPEGLADPGQAPTFPQRRADVMGVEVALGPHAGRLPASVDELAVGPATAIEIGWARSD
ncbi:MAG TPA: hypothetical protein VF341_04150 [Anaeromyxobacteraceae bacterium]